METTSGVSGRAPLRGHETAEALQYLRERFDEPEELGVARVRSEEAGIPYVAPEVGALLRWFAQLWQARAAVEIGTGGGYSGLWMLSGLEPRGTLVTIELDPAHQELAQRMFNEAGVAARARVVPGAALTVLPRLADASYDLVFLDAAKAEYPLYLEHAKRLLRPNGLMVADNVLWGGRVAGTEFNDPETQGLRVFMEALAADPDLHEMVLPMSDGVAVAYLRPERSRR